MLSSIDVDTRVFVVDDDPFVRDALSVIFTHAGYQVTGFPDGVSFLEAAHLRAPSSVLLDVNMPGLSGRDILRRLNAESYGAPIFVMSGQGDIPMAVDAIKHGAIDFIEKPFDACAIAERVRDTVAQWKSRAEYALPEPAPPIVFTGRDLLTPREYEVLGLIAGGDSNKEAGRRLGISPRTIEVHRARIMDKLGAKNAADLVRIVLTDARGH